MIKATDIRIGNILLYDGWHPDLVAKKLPITPYETNIQSIEWDEEKQSYILDGIGGERAFVDSFNPIPLTEEWLEKFGLIKKYLENPFEDGGYDLDEKGNRWYYWVDDGTFNLQIQPNGEIWFEIYSCYRHIKYVHEFQNLYFALSGKELNTK